MVACTPDAAEEELGPKAEAAFTVTPIQGKTNTYLLSSTTENAFLYKWDKGDGFESGAQTDTAYFERKGDYTVKLMALSAGGHDTAEKTISVASNDPNGCTGAKAKLTGCDTKTWVLNPAAGALWIGSPAGDTWWASGAGDVTGRPCTFNDEFIFHKDGTYTYDNKGDLWIEDEGGAAHPADIGLSVGCHAEEELPSKYAAWGAGTHSFEIKGNKLTVKGTGAFLGMYKAGNAGTTAGPEESITYDIVELTDTRLVVKKAYDWGQWVFTFTAK